VELTLLDGIRATTASGGSVQIQPLQGSALFALLAQPGTTLNKNDLLDVLWPADQRPNDTKRPVRLMSDLRRSFGSRIVSGPLGYSYKPATGDHIDLHSWRLLVRQAEGMASTDPRAALELYELTLDIWNTLPDAILPETPFMQDLLTGLRREWINVIERHAEVQLRLGGHAKVADRLLRYVPEWPTRQHLLELLMLALYRARRQSEALDWYRRLREALGAVGAQPDPALQTLHDRICGAVPTLIEEPPELPPADRAVQAAGGSLEYSTQTRMVGLVTQMATGSSYTPKGEFHTSLDRAGIAVLRTCLPEIKDIQYEAADFEAQLVRQLALRDVRQFLVFGALLPAWRTIHEEVRLARPGTLFRVVYYCIDESVVQHAQTLIEGDDDVVFTYGTMQHAMAHPHNIPLINWAQPVGVINQHEFNASADNYTALYAQLGALLAPGSYIYLLSSTNAGMSSKVAWALEKTFRRTRGQAVVSRDPDQVAKVIPPGFEILEPGIVASTALWSHWTEQPVRPELVDNLPRVGVVARKPQPPGAPRDDVRQGQGVLAIG
jgi:DNA-binding SARP family transcriptional activator